MQYRRQILYAAIAGLLLLRSVPAAAGEPEQALYGKASIVFVEEETPPGGGEGGDGGGTPDKGRPPADTNLMSRDGDQVAIPNPEVPGAVPKELPKTGSGSGMGMLPA